MPFFTAITTCLRKYATFSGRASRSEYWWYTLFITLLSLIASALDWMLFPGDPLSEPLQPNWLSNAVSLLVFLPTLAVTWRRMHDSGRPGYLVLLVTLGTTVIAVALGFAILWLLPNDPDLSYYQIGPMFLTLIVGLISLIISAVILWWMTRPSDPGTNRFGPPPQ